MTTIINILICFFIILITYQLFLAPIIIEGYQDCSSDPLIPNVPDE